MACRLFKFTPLYEVADPCYNIRKNRAFLSTPSPHLWETFGDFSFFNIQQGRWLDCSLLIGGKTCKRMEQTELLTHSDLNATFAKCQRLQYRLLIDLADL